MRNHTSPSRNCNEQSRGFTRVQWSRDYQIGTKSARGSHNIFGSTTDDTGNLQTTQESTIHILFQRNQRWNLMIGIPCALLENRNCHSDSGLANPYLSKACCKAHKQHSKTLYVYLHIKYNKFHMLTVITQHITIT